MVWPKLPRPEPSVVADFIEKYDDIGGDVKVKQTIDGRPFTQTIQIILPRRTMSMVDRRKGIDDAELFKKLCPIVSGLLDGKLSHGCEEFKYIHVQRMPVHLLFHKVFIDSYVKQGQVFAVSLNSRIESDNCLALEPSGLLTLNITERTYHRLGLEGRKSLMFKKKNVHDKHIVELNLLSELCSKTDSKYYKRTFSCLQNSGLKFDILIKWVPSRSVSDKVSHLSLIKFFEFVKRNPGDGGGFMSPAEANELNPRICIPTINSHSTSFPLLPITLNKLNWPGDDEGQHILIEDIIEWTGAQCCSVPTNSSTVEADVSTFGFTPDSSIQLNSVKCTQISGFFTPVNIRVLVSELNAYQTAVLNGSNTSEPLHPLAVLIVNGFDECPISWTGKNNEHGKQLTGEHVYTLLLSFNDKLCLLYRLADEYDFSIEKL